MADKKIQADTSLLGGQDDASGSMALSSVTALGPVAASDDNPFTQQMLPALSASDFNEVMQSAQAPLTFSGHATLSAGSKRQQALDFAKGFIGTPYVWGGSSPAGFDCSGLVQYVWRRMGVSLPRVSAQQASAGEQVHDLSKLDPMDLVMMDNTPNGPGHVGFWLGNGMILEAPHTGAQVRIRKLGNNEAMYGVHLAIPN